MYREILNGTLFIRDLARDILLDATQHKTREDPLQQLRRKGRGVSIRFVCLACSHSGLQACVKLGRRSGDGEVQGHAPHQLVDPF